MSSDEVSKAQQAAPTEVTIFDKIASGDIPANVVYQDDLCMAFRDVNPQAPVHVVVIPKDRKGLTGISASDAAAANKELLGHLLYVAGKVGKEECPKGFRLVINDGPQGCQSVYHLHIHVVGGRQMGWPPG
jgi:histidine triad (HIT) family protein